MSTTALLRDRLAPAVGRVLLRLAFGADVAAVGGATLDWLSGRLGKASEAREAERFARRLADGLVAGLAPQFQGSNPEAVALALGETLDAHVDSRFLARHDLNPDGAAEDLLKHRLPELRSQAYAAADIELYRRVMPHLMRRLVHDAKRLPDFQVASTTEVLERLRGLADEQGEIRATVGRLDRARAVWEQRRAEAWDDFERHYAEAVHDRWNKLELFGIDVTDEAQRRQKLSVAYIPLNLQSSGAEEGGVVSPEELLAGAAKGGEPLIILGEAGSGKTTLLRCTACHAIRRALDPDGASPFEGRRGRQREMSELRDDRKRETEERLAWWARVPFLLRLREVKGGVLPKEHDWPAKTAALPRDPPTGWLDEVLDAGHALVLIDGLDELGSQGREVARDTLRAILRDRRGNLVVLTSRPGALDETWFEGISCRVATIRAMAPAQREACITNWHEAVAQAKPKAQGKVRDLGKSLIAKLRHTAHLQEPTTNPLICAATCALYYGSDGYLPTGLVRLFDALIDMLIHGRDERQELVQQADVPEAYRVLDLGAKRQLLEEIAAEMVLCRQSERPRAETLPCIREKLQSLAGHREAKPADIMEGLLLRSGLLRPSGSENVDFLHNDFKEYLAAARFLARGRHPYLIEEADRDPGDRVFFYAYAIASHRGDEALTERLGEGLLNRDSADVELSRRRQMLGLRCKTVTVSAAAAVLSRFDRLIEEALPPRDLKEAEVVAGLGESIVPRLVQPEASAAVQAACARALVMIGTAEALAALEVYRETDEPAVAEELAFAFHPLTIPYWLKRVTTPAEERSFEPALPEAIARQVSDLEPLRHLVDLERLDLRGTAVADFAPLAGLTELEWLDLEGTAVADLAPLAGLTGLQRLNLGGTAVADFAPLAGLIGLQRLDLGGTAVADFAPLAGLTALEWLNLSGTAVADLAPLAGLTQLDTLFLGGTGVTDLAPLARLSGLQWLDLSATAVADLAPLAGLTELETLFLSGTGVTDLAPLAGLTGLQGLYLRGTAVADLAPLAGLTQLDTLFLGGTGVTDLAPLARLTGLQRLYLRGTAVADVAPLAGLTELQVLNLSGTAVADLAPLAGLTGLQRLHLSGTGVTNLAPLAGLTQLRQLDLSGTAVTDLAPVRHIEHILGP